MKELALKELALQLQLNCNILQLQLQLYCNYNLGFYEETLIFQTSNFRILIQGLDAPS
jgi:hypothetical protein